VECAETFVTWGSRPVYWKEVFIFGYEFDSPWTELMRERKMESVAILNFSTGGFIEVLAPSKNGDELDAMKHEAEKRGVDIRNVFGDETTHSNYALRSKVLSLTPRDLRRFLPDKKWWQILFFLF